MLTGLGELSFAPFKTSNLNRDPDAKYKAVCGTRHLYAFKSPAGINRTRMSDGPILDGEGAFVSRNTGLRTPSARRTGRTTATSVTDGGSSK